MKPRNDETHFPHHRLDAYRVAVDAAVAARRLAGAIPRGHRAIADQLQRAGSSAVLLIAEGANRRSRADKRQRFVLARGEVGELAAAAELAAALGLVDDAEAQALMQLAGRVAAMLTRLTGPHR